MRAFTDLQGVHVSLAMVVENVLSAGDRRQREAASIRNSASKFRTHRMPICADFVLLLRGLNTMVFTPNLYP